jgi:hypothetical protein
MSNRACALSIMSAAAILLPISAGCASVPAPTPLPTTVQVVQPTNPPASPINSPTAPAATRVIPTATAVPTLAAPTPTTGPTKERVTFKSGDLTLVGYLFKPGGQGPFPGIIWNHGSEKDPDTGPEFDSVASIFVPAGYVVFAPVRRSMVLPGQFPTC